MTDTQHPVDGRAPSQGVAAAVGGVFVLVGVLGFVPGVTSHVAT